MLDDPLPALDGATVKAPARDCLGGEGALKLLADLGLKPKRTIRAVMWNAEENSGAGAEPFLKSFLGL